MRLPDLIKTTKAVQLWEHWTLQQRLMAAGTVLLLLVALGGVLHWAVQDKYVPVVGSLELSQVERVTSTLKEAGISYRLGGGGTTVLVPERDLARARVRLAGEGLPAKGHPGFELFDTKDWSATSFGEQVKYQRALKGELERTIAEFNGVRAATVHFTVPRQSPFRKERREAEASVFLKLEPGYSLSKETVQAIVYLVSSSIEWLPPEKVTVLDDSGRVLSSPVDHSTASLGNRQFELQREVERYIEEKVFALLSGIVGATNVRVASSVRLNFDQIERAMEQYDPSGSVVLSEQRSAVVPGTPQNAAVLLAPGTSTETRNYHNSHSVERIKAAVGSIERLTVSVLINDKIVPTDSGVVFEPRSEQELAIIEALVRDAVGAMDERGDRVTVSNVRFEGDPSLYPYGDESRAITLDSWMKPALAVLAGIVVLAIVWRLIGFLRRDRSVLEETSDTPDALDASRESEVSDDLVDQVETEIAPAVMLEIKEPMMVRETEGLVRGNPELAARLFRLWLKEG